MPDQTLLESYLTPSTDGPPPPPFLPNSTLQYAWVKKKAVWLIKNAIQNGECLDCHLIPNAKGYSPISFGRAVKSRANRVVYFAYNPLHDQSLMVLHTCDNRRRIRLDHLFLGTAQDNTNDMIAKGRANLIHPRQLNKDADRMRGLYKQGLSIQQIANKFFVSPNTVRNYVTPKGAYYAS